MINIDGVEYDQEQIFYDNKTNNINQRNYYLNNKLVETINYKNEESYNDIDYDQIYNKEIKEMAYYLWIKSNKQSGKDIENWNDAKKIIIEKHKNDNKKENKNDNKKDC